MVPVGFIKNKNESVISIAVKSKELKEQKEKKEKEEEKKKWKDLGIEKVPEVKEEKK